MANLTFFQPLNMTLNESFYPATEDNILQADTQTVISRNPKGNTDNYTGNFIYSNGDLIDGIITGYSEISPTLGTIRTISASVPYLVYDHFAQQNNSLGLFDYFMSGNDTVTGSGGNDSLLGYSGNDLITGSGGNDWINGNQGSDDINGNMGNDTVQGGKDNDIVRGGKGDDDVNGNNANDQVFGGEGNDIVRGGKDNDTVSGGNGNDTILGDLGNDLLSGNAGTDIFLFASGSGQDTITDFNHLEGDRIQIQTGITSFTGLSISDSAQSAVINLGGGNLITLTGISANQLTASDFVFF